MRARTAARALLPLALLCLSAGAPEQIPLPRPPPPPHSAVRGRQDAPPAPPPPRRVAFTAGRVRGGTARHHAALRPARIECVARRAGWACVGRGPWAWATAVRSPHVACGPQGCELSYKLDFRAGVLAAAAAVAATALYGGFAVATRAALAGLSGGAGKRRAAGGVGERAALLGGNAGMGGGVLVAEAVARLDGVGTYARMIVRNLSEASLHFSSVASTAPPSPPRSGAASVAGDDGDGGGGGWRGGRAEARQAELLTELFC